MHREYSKDALTLPGNSHCEMLTRQGGGGERQEQERTETDRESEREIARDREMS